MSILQQYFPRDLSNLIIGYDDMGFNNVVDEMLRYVRHSKMSMVFSMLQIYRLSCITSENDSCLSPSQVVYHEKQYEYYRIKDHKYPLWKNSHQYNMKSYRLFQIMRNEYVHPLPSTPEFDDDEEYVAKLLSRLL